MASCVGSGVPGDLLEWGHDIVPGTEPQMFRMNRRSKTSCYARQRCRVCESSRYNWAKKVDFRVKAGTTHKAHARKMVEKGKARNEAEALTLMLGSGLTVDFIAEMFRVSINHLCPGRCGWPERHRIIDNADLHFDWRDPNHPLTPENCGPLCASCNKQKQEMPWAAFMSQQHAIRINLDNAVPREAPLRLFDPDLMGV